MVICNYFIWFILYIVLLIYTCQIWFAYNWASVFFLMPNALGAWNQNSTLRHERLKWIKMRNTEYTTLELQEFESESVLVSNMCMFAPWVKSLEAMKFICGDKACIKLRRCAAWFRRSSRHAPEKPVKTPQALKKDFSTFADRSVCLSDSKCNILRYISVKLAIKLSNFSLFSQVIEIKSQVTI